jgi:hypothetical protein
MTVSKSLPRPRQRRTVGAKTRLRVECFETRMLLSVDVVGVMEGTNSNNSSCGCTPPDTAGAAGPYHVIETVNSAYAVYDKTSGALISRTSLRTLFTPLGGVQSLSDPVIVYDEFTGQFVIAVLDYNQSARLSRLDVAISNDYDPADGFYMQRYDMNDGVGSFDFADYPKMGYNADAYVISMNMFPTGGSFHVDTLSIDKTNLTGYRKIVPGSHSTMTPSVMHGSNPGDPMWFVETGSGTNMKVVQMTNLLSSNPNYTTYTVAVPSYSSPPSAGQPGGGGIPTVGSRVLDAAYNGGLLVGAHTIGSGGIARARWYEFDTTTPTPTLVQSGTIDQGPGVYTYFPTIEINSELDLGMTFIESSSSEYMSMYVTGQSVYDYGSGTMQPPVVTHPGTSHYGSSRAGDYSGISVDPADGYTFRAANEYKGNAGWNTGVAGFGVSPNFYGPAPGRIAVAASTQRLLATPSQPAPTSTAVPSRAAESERAAIERLFAATRETPAFLAAPVIRDENSTSEPTWEDLSLGVDPFGARPGIAWPCVR